MPGVGKNLQDHSMATIFYLCNIPTLSESDFTPEYSQKWQTEGRGALTSCIVESHAWLQVNENDKTQFQVPNIQIQFCPVTVGSQFSDNLNYKPEIFEQCLKPHLSDGKQRTAFIASTLLHPKSRGEITLASRDPFVHPKIDPKYLENPEDLRMLIAGCKKIDQICQTEPLKSVFKPLTDEFVKISREENKDQFWEDYIRNYLLTVYHPIGTCKMGKDDDRMSVVSPSTRVKGVKGLRVVDASIILACPSGNTNVPVIAIAERVADLIQNGA